MRRVLFVLLVATLGGCVTAPPPEGSRAEIYEATQRWAAAFNACDVDRSTSLYDVDAVLWGTVSPALISTPPGIHQYYERICSVDARPSVVLGDEVIRNYGDTAIAAGTYSFNLYAQGVPRTVSARFTFTFRRRDGRWLIIEHHSSVIPAPVVMP